MEDDRRLEYRILADLIVRDLKLDPSVMREAKGAIRELSASGCRLESSLSLKIGQEIDLSFQLTEDHKIENVRARVVRRLSQRTHKVVAVEFVNISAENQFKIREFIVWKEAQEAGK